MFPVNKTIIQSKATSARLGSSAETRAVRATAESRLSMVMLVSFSTTEISPVLYSSASHRPGTVGQLATPLCLVDWRSNNHTPLESWQ